MFCMNCGQELPEGAKFCKRCGTPQGAVSPDGTYKPEKDDADSTSTKDAPKLGSFSIDGEDTGEVLPQRSSDSANLFSLASKPNPNAAAPVEKSGPSPFKPAEEKKSDINSSIFRPLGSANREEAPKAAVAPSPFRSNASAPVKKEEEAPKAAPAPINSAFKPTTPAAKKEEAPKSSFPSAFRPAGSSAPAKKEEAPKATAPAAAPASAPINSAFKPATPAAKKEEAPKASPAPAASPINSAFKPAGSAAPAKKEEAPKASPAPAASPINNAFKPAGSDNKKEETGFKPLGAKSELPKQPQPSNPFKSFGLTKADAESDSSGSGLGAYRPMSEEETETSGPHHEEPKLGSFSVDAEDTGEVLPQRSESERSTLFSLAGKANPDSAPSAPSGPSPFRQADKPNAFASNSNGLGNNAFAAPANNSPFAAPANNQSNSPFAAPANNSPFASAPVNRQNSNQGNNPFAAPANNSPFAAAPSPFKPASGGLGSSGNVSANDDQPKSSSPFKATSEDFADIVDEDVPEQKNNPFGMMSGFVNNNANAKGSPTTFKNTLFKEPEPEPEIDPTAVARPKASPYSPVYRKPSQEKAEAEAAEAKKKAAAEVKTEEPKKKVNLAPQQGNPFVPIEFNDEDIDNFPLSSVSPFKPLS